MISFSFIGSLFFLFCVSTAVYLGSLHPAALGIYLGTSLVTFIVYGRDKTLARRGAWRTKEKTLHFLALIGGWPGAILAQKTFRHKTTKASFRFVFWFTVILNCSGFLWVIVPDTTEKVRVLIAHVLGS